MLIAVIAIVMVIVTLSFGWELFLDVQLIQRGFFCGSSRSTSHSFLCACCQLLREQVSDALQEERGKTAGRKLEMRPGYSGIDLYPRISKVHRQVCWVCLQDPRGSCCPS